jgi:hypothetical protein
VQTADPPKPSNIKPLQQLGNFVKGWDVSRCAALIENLRKDAIPNLNQIKETAQAIRVIRNITSHEDADPDNQGISDAKLLSVLDLARENLPKINNLDHFERRDIYDRLEMLENIFHPSLDYEVIHHSGQARLKYIVDCA